MISHCSHPTCRTSLDDESVVYCGHDVKFCEHCDWADGCDDCHLDVLRSRAAAAWDAAAVPGPYINPARDAAIDQAAELRADQRAYELAQLEDREEGDRYGAA